MYVSGYIPAKLSYQVVAENASSSGRGMAYQSCPGAQRRERNSETSHVSLQNNTRLIPEKINVDASSAMDGKSIYVVKLEKIDSI